MKDPNAKRPGYKKTKVGWIPVEWEVSTLARLVDPRRPICYGVVQTGDPVDIGVPCVRVADLAAGGLDPSRMIKTTEDIHQQYRRTILQRGDLMVALRGEVGRAEVVPEQLEGANLTRGVALLSKSSAYNPTFLRAALSSHMVSRIVRLNINGTALKEIPIESLKRIPVPVPPKEEQNKIAAVLTACDSAMDRTRALIDAKRQQKKALMQQLLTGRKRLPGFMGEWVRPSIGQLFQEVTRPVDWDDSHEYALLSVRRRSGGVVLRERLLGAEIATKVMFVAHEGDFLISRMQVLHGATGLVPADLDGCHISGSYIALRPIDRGLIDPAFFACLSEMAEFRHLTYLCSYGVHIEKMTFNPDWFFRSRVTIPPTAAEQRAIADILSAADSEIALLESKLEALKRQKKGLMQKLLTGQIRVKERP